MCYLVEHGYGTFSQVSEMDDRIRSACYYASLEMQGYEVSWETGAVRRPPS